MINKLIELGKENNIDIEVSLDKCKEFNIEVLNDKLMNFNELVENSYQIKAIYNDKTCTLSYEKIDNPEEIIKNIISNINIIDNNNKNRLCENNYESRFNDERNIDFSKIKNDLLELNNLHDKYPFIVNIDSNINYVSNCTLIENSKNHMNDSYSYFYMVFYISAKKGDKSKTYYYQKYDSDFDIKMVKKELDECIHKLELSLDAESIKTNKYRIILNNLSVGKILSKLISSFHEKNLDLNLSPFTDKLGEKIFSEKISIMEEPVNDKFTVNKHFDKEGVLTYNKNIVENGVFKTAINSLEYAIKNNTKPTANASGTTNLHIKEGNKNFDELVSLLDNGIIIENVEGLHAGINTVTGEISLQSTGFLVENGKIVKALEMIIIQTNLQEILTNVMEVGNDLKEFDPSWSSVSLLLDNITISGNK